MKGTYSKTIFFLILFVNFTALGQPQKLKDQDLYVYNGGVYHHTQQGKLAGDKKETKFEANYNPINGCFWIYNNKSLRYFVELDTLKKTVVAQSISDLLEIYVGKEISLSYVLKETPMFFKGKLISFNKESGLIQFKEISGGITFLFLNSINILSLNGVASDKISVEKDSIIRFIKIPKSENEANSAFTLSYLANGVNWFPSYLVKWDGKKARVELKSTLVNTTQRNFENTKTKLAVGFPKIINPTSLDPIAENFSLFNPNQEQSFQPYQQRNFGAAEMSMDANVLMNKSFETKGETEQDLFFYDLGLITLKSGSRDVFPIQTFENVVTEKHSVHISDHINFINARAVTPNNKNTFDVLHILEVQNLAKVPMVAGPAFIVGNSDQFLAQDQLSFTVVGDVAKITLAKTKNIKVTNEEELLATENLPKEANKRPLLISKLQGSIDFENFGDKEISLEIIKTVQGKVVNGSEGSVKILKSYDPLNPISEIKWVVVLKAKQKKGIKYDYEVKYLNY